MSRTYLLLRNNQQTGPYSFEEILAFNLKPFDLVWEEGRSAAWRYPGEIDSLKPYVIATPQPATPFEPLATSVMEMDPRSLDSKNEIPVEPVPTPAKNIFVSLPRKASPFIPVKESPEIPALPDLLELKAETVFQKVQAPGNESLHENEFHDKAREFNYYRPVKNKPVVSPKGLLAFTGILVAILAVYFMYSGSSSNINTKEQQVSPQATILPRSNPIEEMDSNLVKEGSVNEVVIENQVAENNKQQGRQVHKPVQEKILSHTAAAATYKTGDLAVVNTAVEENISLPTDEQKIAGESLGNNPTEPVKEKKKLRDVVKGIFSKKKDDKNEPLINEPVPVPDRKAKKRENRDETQDEITSDADINLLAANIELLIHSTDNWMMGIKGMKVTLRNNNAVAIQSAIVLVNYFDGNNKLLEKKSIVFNNIPPKGKLTLPVPDHQYADHTELSLGNLSIRKDVYAKD